MFETVTETESETEGRVLECRAGTLETEDEAADKH